MPKPIAGRKYTIVQGDNLSTISSAAYGSPRDWRKIWKANKVTLRSGDPDLIFPGEVIWIPGQVEAESAERAARGDAASRLPGKDPDDFTIVVDGIEVPCIDGTAFRAVDTCADGFAAVIPWDSTGTGERTRELAEKLKPYSYPDVECYLGGELVMRGRLYTVAASISAQGVTLDLEGWSYAADLVDSTVRPPYEAKKVTLEQRIKDLIEGFAIDLDFQLEDDDAFERITIQPTETVFNHILDLARQRKALVTSDAQGALVVAQAAVDSGSVFTLEEGRRPLAQASIRFDGRARFNTYEAITSAPRKKGKNNPSPTAVAKDDRVPAARMLRFQVDDVTESTIQEAANWERSRHVADSLGVTIPVDGWQVPGTQDLWRENTIVTLKSASLFVPDGFDFLIRSVEYVFGDTGTTARLELVPPETYTGEEIEEPWT